MPTPIVYSATALASNRALFQYARTLRYQRVLYAQISTRSQYAQTRISHFLTMPKIAKIFTRQHRQLKDYTRIRTHRKDTSSMDIHVIYTGGTIGMKHTAEGLAPESHVETWLDQQLAETEFEGHVHTYQLSPLIDSSNATPATWQLIIDAIREHAAEATAFVILHGTDTLAYTASALSFALQDLPVPVIMTGSQLPFTHDRSDALPNVIGALHAAAQPHLRGVFVFFGRHLYQGNRTTKVSSWSFDAFDSPAATPVAKIADSWTWTSCNKTNYAGSNQENCDPLSLNDFERSLQQPEQLPLPYKNHDAIVLHITPGLTAKRLQAFLTPLPRGVILRGYGTGNIPADEPGFVDVLADAADQGCIIIASTQTPQARVDLSAYATGSALMRAGVISGEDATIETLYTKLIFLLSQERTTEEIRMLMGTPLANELTISH